MLSYEDCKITVVQYICYVYSKYSTYDQCNIWKLLLRHCMFSDKLKDYKGPIT